MEINDILQVKQFFEQDGNEALIVSYFRVDTMTDTDINEINMAEWFHKQFAANILPIWLTDTALYKRTVVDNLTTPIVFGDWAQDFAGDQIGDTTPAFTAIDIKLNVGTRITRAGRKRLPFLSEIYVTGNNIGLGGSEKAELQTWFGQAINVTNPTVPAEFVGLQPVIVGRTETPVDSGNYVLDLAKINPVTSAIVLGATTQNSRKV